MKLTDIKQIHRCYYKTPLGPVYLFNSEPFIIVRFMMGPRLGYMWLDGYKSWAYESDYTVYRNDNVVGAKYPFKTIIAQLLNDYNQIGDLKCK